MRAITLQDDDLQFHENVPAPSPVDDEVVVNVIQAGICETDLQLARGYMGFSGILGHEFVGIAQTGSLAGKRVVGEINCNCRQCIRCNAGLGNHCGNRTVVGIDRHDGAFAEKVAIPQFNLHEIPDSVSDDQAVFVEPLAAAFQIAAQVEIMETDRIAILGDGRLGFLCAQALKLRTPNLSIVGKHPGKLSRFDTFGIATIQKDELQASSHRTFDVVVDCTGSETGLEMALQLVRPRGTIVMKTTVAANHQLSLASIVIDEITVIGSRCGPFAVAIEALQNGTIDVSGLITHRFDLESAEQAFAAAVDSQAFKVVFDLSINPSNA